VIASLYALAERIGPFDAVKRDPFFNRENIRILEKSIAEIDAGHGMNHDLIDPDD
jgi:hypothetical protein